MVGAREQDAVFPCHCHLHLSAYCCLTLPLSAVSYPSGFLSRTPHGFSISLAISPLFTSYLCLLSVSPSQPSSSFQHSVTHTCIYSYRYIFPQTYIHIVSLSLFFRLSPHTHRLPFCVLPSAPYRVAYARLAVSVLAHGRGGMLDAEVERAQRCKPCTQAENKERKWSQETLTLMYARNSIQYENVCVCMEVFNFA